MNRISLGVQSLDEALLDRLGRVHTRRDGLRIVDILRQAGFDNLNLDLMFAIPGQTLEVWRDTLAEAAAMGSEHLSSYEVIYEEDTPLYEQLQAGKVDVDEDLACAMYEELVEQASEGRLPTIRRSPTSPATSPSTLNPQPSTSPPAAASTMSITGGAALFTAWARARPPTSGACGQRTASNTQLYCEQLEQGAARRRIPRRADAAGPRRRDRRLWPADGRGLAL